MTSRLSSPLAQHARPRLGVSAALVATASLALAACGGGGGASVDGISVEGAFGEAPTVEIDRPFDLTESESQVLIDGEGEEVAEGDEVSLDFFVTDGTTGDSEQSSYEAEPIVLALEEGTASPDLLDALVGASVNDRVLIALAPEPAPEGAPAGASVPPTGTDTVVFILDILEILPPALDQAEGEAVEPPEGLPVVETDADDAVTGITVPEGVPAPTELVVTTLIEGTGTPVEADSNLIVHYTGVLFDTGEVFDSSWGRGEPAQFPLTGVIPGWQEGLVGVPVGSRVLLSIPPELGYAEAGSPPTIPANAPLVFVIDVLAAR